MDFHGLYSSENTPHLLYECPCNEGHVGNQFSRLKIEIQKLKWLAQGPMDMEHIDLEYLGTKTDFTIFTVPRLWGPG